MIYLACPYEGLDKEKVMYNVNRITARFLRGGIAVYSPLTIGHYAATEWPELFDLSNAHWAKIEKESMKHCSMLCIITLDKWSSSAGIARELALADELNIPILYVEPEGT